MYNPYFKLDVPHDSDGEDYWYGFRCEQCGEQDMGHYSKNDKLPKGHTTLCSNCFRKLPGLQI